MTFFLVDRKNKIINIIIIIVIVIIIVSDINIIT